MTINIVLNIFVSPSSQLLKNMHLHVEVIYKIHKLHIYIIQFFFCLILIIEIYILELQNVIYYYYILLYTFSMFNFNLLFRNFI